MYVQTIFQNVIHCNKFALPRIYSIVPSNTRLSRGSNPFSTPLAKKEGTQCETPQ